MIDRLYYTDPTLLEFDARFVELASPANGRPGIVLDRTAFYPTSGGQLHDTGRLGGLRVVEVSESDDGRIVHWTEASDQPAATAIRSGAVLHGVVDAARRRDHMQQHTGQHLLSAVFIELFNAPTVSFHMGDASCTIDLDTKSLTDDQARSAEFRANEIVTDDVPVEIKFATAGEARGMGVRKIPSDVRDKLRLIEIKGHDLTACGGTHVSRTGQIGPILLRKIEKVKQGMRVEFVCGGRAIRSARRDFDTLTSSAALFSSNLFDVPEQIGKTLDELKAAGKRQQKTLEELAEYTAAGMLNDVPEEQGVRLVKRLYADRDLAFIKLLAQKLAQHPNVIALLGTTSNPAAVVFSQSPGQRFDMGALMKEGLARVGGRGGGSRDLAQGGVPAGVDLEGFLSSVAKTLK